MVSMWVVLKLMRIHLISDSIFWLPNFKANNCHHKTPSTFSLNRLFLLED